MIRTILPIVEGQSELEGLPVLLRRLLNRIGHSGAQIARPFRVKRTQLLHSGVIEHAVLQGMKDRQEITGTLIIFDADDDDPDHLEASLLERCRRVSSLPIAVVAARRELEAWFLGSKESLRGVCGIRAGAKAPDSPEAIRGAKERLTRNMDHGCRYFPTRDLPVMAAKMDLDLALQRCLSFRKLLTELERLLAETS